MHILESGGDRHFQRVAMLQQARVNLVKRRCAERAGDLELANRLRHDVQGQVKAVRAPQQDGKRRLLQPLSDRSFPARIVLRQLDRELAEATDEPTALQVSKDGSGFRLGSGPWVELPDGPVIRRVLSVLVEQRLRTPGLPLSTPEVLRRSWPGERIRPESGALRVRHTVSRLRRIGLAGVLRTSRAGYFLDPAVSLDLAEPSTPPRSGLVLTSV